MPNYIFLTLLLSITLHFDFLLAFNIYKIDILDNSPQNQKHLSPCEPRHNHNNILVPLDYNFNILVP